MHGQHEGFGLAETGKLVLGLAWGGQAAPAVPSCSIKMQEIGLQPHQGANIHAGSCRLRLPDGDLLYSCVLFLMSTSCNRPCKTEGGELLLINVHCFQGACSRGSAGRIRIRWAVTRHSVAERCAHTRACIHTGMHTHMHTHMHARRSSCLDTDATTNPLLPPCPGLSAGP